MPGNRAKQHHYIPRHYLRGFCDCADPDRLVVFTKHSERVFQTGTHNIAKEKGFYLEEIERALAGGVESPAEPVLRSLRSGEEISGRDREVLAMFVVNLQRRVPSFRDVVIAMIPKQKDETFEQIRRAIRNDADPIQRKKHLAELDDLQERWKDGLPPDLVHQLVQPLTSGAIENHLLTMHWYFCFTAGPSSFVSCDNPVFIFPWGLDKPDSELSVPLARNVTLIATSTPREWSQYGYMPELVVRELNRRAVQSAKKHVYYCHDAKWLRKMVMKPHLRLNRLRSNW